MGEIAEPQWGKAVGAGVLALLVTLIVVSIAYSVWMPGTGMMAWMWVWMLVPILLVAALVALVVGLTQRREPTESDQAAEIASRRYARGEISREEYLRIRDDLSP